MDEPISPDRRALADTRKIAHALFKGDTQEAVQILKKASKTHPELLFVSLALQLIGRGDHHLAAEHLDFDEVVAAKADPFLRAISSYIATGNCTASKQIPQSLVFVLFFGRMMLSPPRRPLIRTDGC